MKSSGLVIHPENHWPAASPDGLVTDPAAPDPTGIVKFYRHRDITLRDAASEARDFCLRVNTQTSSLRLKHSHHYYYHIQAAIFCARVKWWNFVLHTNVDLHIQQVPWDQQFWCPCYLSFTTFVSLP